MSLVLHSTDKSDIVVRKKESHLIDWRPSESVSTDQVSPRQNTSHSINPFLIGVEGVAGTAVYSLLDVLMLSDKSQIRYSRVRTERDFPRSHIASLALEILGVKFFHTKASGRNPVSENPGPPLISCLKNIQNSNYRHRKLQPISPSLPLFH